MLIGDLEDTAEGLSDQAEPWRTVGAALLDAGEAWHREHPGWWMRRDFAQRRAKWRRFRSQFEP